MKNFKNIIIFLAFLLYCLSINAVRAEDTSVTSCSNLNQLVDVTICKFNAFFKSNRFLHYQKEKPNSSDHLNQDVIDNLTSLDNQDAEVVSFSDNSEDDQEEFYFVLGLLFLALILLPFIPGWILERKVKKNQQIVFAHFSELRAYQTSLISLLISLMLYLTVTSNNLKIFSILLALFGMTILIALFGFQKITSNNLFSALILYILKILFVIFGFVLIFIGTGLSYIFARDAYRKAKEKKRVDAAVSLTLALGSAKATHKFGSSYFGKESVFVNGPYHDDFSGAFPDKGVFDVIKMGIRVLIVSIFLANEKIYLQRILKHYRETGKSVF